MSDFDFAKEEGPEKKPPVLKPSKKSKNDDDDTPIRSKKRGLARVPVWAVGLVASFALALGIGMGLLAGMAIWKPGRSAFGGLTSKTETVSRKDLQAWLEKKSADEVKARFGRPSLTRVVPGPISVQNRMTLRYDYTEYHYENLSIDSDGSGKVDSKVIISFFEAGGAFAKVEFVN